MLLLLNVQKVRKAGQTKKILCPADAIDRYLKLYLETRTDDLDDLFISNYGGKVKPVSTNTFNQWCKIFGIPWDSCISPLL